MICRPSQFPGQHSRREPIRMFAATPEPPFTAVIFTSLRKLGQNTAYAATSVRMTELAEQQPGFLGVESVRDETGLGITVSYWRDAASAALWKKNFEHLAAQQAGREQWYQQYALRICTVERQTTFTSP